MILSWTESSAVQIHASVAAQTPMMMSSVTISGAVCGVSIDLQNGTSYPAQRLTRPRFTNGNVATTMNVRATRCASSRYCLEWIVVRDIDVRPKTRSRGCCERQGVATGFGDRLCGAGRDRPLPGTICAATSDQ